MDINKKKHQQFGLKLLFLAFVAALVFTVWYISEKRENSVATDTGSFNAANQQVPGDELTDLKERYLDSARSLVTSGYDMVQLANDYSLKVFNADGTYKIQDDPVTFWNSFSDSVTPVTNSAYEINGNQVRVFLNMVRDGEEKKYLRLFNFSNYDKPGRTSIQPVIWQEALIPIDQLPAFDAQPRGEWIGTSLNDLLSARESEFAVLKNGVSGKANLTDFSDNKWKLILLGPGAFPQPCAGECRDLKKYAEEFDELGVSVFIATGDLPGTLGAWSKVFYGGLPYTLISDPTLLLARKFGFADTKRMLTDHGTLLVDPEGKLKYLSVLDKQSSRDMSFYLTIINSFKTPQL